MGSRVVIHGDFPASPTYKKQVIHWIDNKPMKPVQGGNPRTDSNHSKPLNRKYRNKVPRVLSPLPYLLETVHTDVWEYRGNYSKIAFSEAIRGSKSLEVAVRNQMVIDTRDKLDSGLQLLADLAEAKGLIRSTEKRLMSTLKYVAGIKKNVAKELAFWAGTSKRGRNIDKIPAAWLEFHFMVKPAIGSCNDLVGHLNNPMPWFPIKGKGEGFTSVVNDSWNKQLTLGMRQGGLVRIKNPNVNLVNQMGLTDVFGAALELTPWSWALGYFINLSDLLGNISPKWSQMEFVDWYNNQKITSSGFYKTYVPGTATKGNLSFEAAALYRSLGFVNTVSPQILASLNLQRCSYLSSAIALTMKGKLK